MDSAAAKARPDHHHVGPCGHFHGPSPRSLYIAVFINILLTIFQLIGGWYSSSLSLMADATHNLSDAGALVIAALAAKISRLPANQKMTFGFRRAEIIGALINSSTLGIIGLFLIFQAVSRFFNPSPVDGLTLIIVASVALIIDLATAFLTYSGAKESVNIRAAFLHNVSDAMASVVVIASGILIYLYQLFIFDLIATLIISIYILYHSYLLIRQCTVILMQGVPFGVDLAALRSGIESLPDIKEAHHIHVWQLDDKKVLFECHIVIHPQSLSKIESIKEEVRNHLKTKHGIHHSTLEIETGLTCNNVDSEHFIPALRPESTRP